MPRKPARTSIEISRPLAAEAGAMLHLLARAAYDPEVPKVMAIKDQFGRWITDDGAAARGLRAAAYAGMVTTIETKPGVRQWVPSHQGYRWLRGEIQ